MSLFLVCPELQFTLELALNAAAEELVERQIERIQQDGDSTRFELRLADEIGKILPETVDWDIKAPTRAQMALAHSLCQRLGIVISPSALGSRYEMHLFIAQLSVLSKARSACPTRSRRSLKNRSQQR